MNASYEYADFPARPSQRECLSCKFAEVCPEAGILKNDYNQIGDFNIAKKY